MFTVLKTWVQLSLGVFYFVCSTQKGGKSEQQQLPFILSGSFFLLCALTEGSMQKYRRHPLNICSGKKIKSETIALKQ